MNISASDAIKIGMITDEQWGLLKQGLTLDLPAGRRIREIPWNGLILEGPLTTQESHQLHHIDNGGRCPWSDDCRL